MTQIWGNAPDGSTVYAHRLEGHGLRARILTFGACLQDFGFAGAEHKSLILAYPRLAPYLINPNYLGASIGRYANRIAKGQAHLGNLTLDLERNQGALHHLHGGSGGSAFANWQIQEADPQALTLSLTMADGHMGYPGCLQVQARFELRAPGTLAIIYSAYSDCDTLCNFTPHTYFNLSGAPDIGTHTLQVQANHYIEVDAAGIPLAPPKAVAGTPYDFRTPRTLEGANTPVQPIDNTFCLSPTRRAVTHAATLQAAGHSICELWTSEPGLQVYTGAHLRGLTTSDASYDHRPFSGIALEPQIWPDAPNQPGFPDAVLRAGTRYEHETHYRVTPC